MSFQQYMHLCKDVYLQLSKLTVGKEPLYLTDAVLWPTYAQMTTCFERDYHFIHHCGGIVTVNADLTYNTIWDGVDDVLSNQVKEASIKEPFIIPIDRSSGGPIRVGYSEMYFLFPPEYTNCKADKLKDYYCTNAKLLLRALREIKLEAIEYALNLCDSQQLSKWETVEYRLFNLRELLLGFSNLNPQQQVTYAFVHNNAPSCRIINSAIGSLLLNVSKSMDVSLQKYEHMVSPSKYKRPKVSNDELKKAYNTLDTLGYSKSVKRRLATKEDVGGNALFTSKNSAEPDNTTYYAHDFNDAPEISISELFSKRLDKLEILLEGKHEDHLVALTAPTDSSAPNLFKWDNNISWCYSSGDSIKQRVTDAGGKVNGKLRVSLSWNNTDDLDLHLTLPNNKTIMYSNKRVDNAVLDVDANQSSSEILTSTPVENIIFTKEVPDGEYNVKVTQYKRRDEDGCYEVEIEYDGKVYTLSELNSPSQGNYDEYTFYIEDNCIQFSEKTDGLMTNNKYLWNLCVNHFHNVSLSTLSPNYWSNNVETKHYFFFLDKARPYNLRPFLNVLIKNDLYKKLKKVFEVVGSNLNVEGNEGLAGIGFTNNAKFICRINSQDVYQVVANG